jgi:tetratricopeptide (TPR) repeat protein
MRGPRVATLLVMTALAGCATAEEPVPAPAPAPAPATSSTPSPPAPVPVPAPVPGPIPSLSSADALARAEKLLADGMLAEAVEAAREAAALDPKSAAPLLLQARAERLLARQATDAADGTTAQLRLIDARKTAARLVEVAPGDPEALREAGRIQRDSFLFAEAAASFRKAMEAAKSRDGETVYDLAYCVAYGGDFAGGLDAFTEAEGLLGPQLRITVNAAICEERVGKRKAATDRLARFYAAEVAAGRAAGADAKRALEMTWEVTVQKRDFEAGVQAYRSLAEAHRGRPEPWFMLGNLLSFLARHGEAAEAYRLSLAAAPLPAARVRRARELAASGPGVLQDADAAIREALKQGWGEEDVGPVVLRIARMQVDAGMPLACRKLVEEARSALPEEGGLDLLDGDALLCMGKAGEARAAYERARELLADPAEAEARASRAALAALRSGGSALRGAAETFPDVAAAPVDAKAPAEPILDFEEAALLVRPLGGVKIVDGAARLPAPAAGESRRIGFHFFPELDAGAWSHCDLRLRSEGGDAALRVEMADGMDQMSDLPQGRLLWPGVGKTEKVGAAWRTVAVPLREFEILSEVRSVPADLPRVKCLVLDAAGPASGAQPSLWIDSVVLRDAKSGKSRVLQAFDEGIEENSAVFEGSTPPFTRHILTPEAAMDLLPTGTTAVSKAILEDQGGEFLPAMVGRGKGALRIRAGETAWYPSREAVEKGSTPPFPDGPASVRVVVSPPRDFLRFSAITFMARGEKGGEKLRVRLQDARGVVLERTIAAERWPRSYFPRTAGKDGAVVLEKEWRAYRIPFAAYPEVDFGGLAEITFEIGSEVANAPGAMVYLDEIGMER